MLKNNSPIGEPAAPSPDAPVSEITPLRYGMTNDYMFRAVFQKSNRSLRHLLSALLDIPYEEILSCEITNPIILGEAIDEKTCILDIRVLLNQSRLINLEMQVGNLNHWPNRSLFYLSRLFCNIGHGENYGQIKPSVHIGILTQNPFPEVRELYSEYLMMNPKNQHIFSSNFSLRMLDLSQINHRTEKDSQTELVCWARLFRATTWEEIRMLTENSDALKEAADYLRELSQEEKIRQQCEGRERYYMDMSCAKSEGRAEGLAEGDARRTELMFALITAMSEDQRLSDIPRLAKDPAFYQEMLRHYHIEEFSE